MKNKITNISLDLSSSSPKYYSSSSRTYQAKKLNPARQEILMASLGNSQLLQQLRGQSESPHIRRSSEIITPKNTSNKMALPSVDRMSPMNKSTIKTPSRFSAMAQNLRKEEVKKSNHELSDVESFVLRQHKVLSGKEIIKKSNEIINSMKSPKDIYNEALSFQRDESSNSRYGKVKLRTLAKRFGVTFNLRDPGEVKNEVCFLKEIPMEYYQKLKELPKKIPRKPRDIPRRRLRSPKCFQKEQEETIPTIENLYIPITNLETDIFDQEVISPEEKLERAMRIKKKEPVGVGIVKREKNLFLSALEERVESYSTPKVYMNRRRYSTTFDEASEDYSLKNVTMREFEKKDNSDWITKTSDLRHEINRYLARPNNDFDFVENCQEKIEDDIKKLEIEQIQEEIPLKNQASLYDKEDTDDLAKAIKDRKGLIYSVLKGKNSAKNWATGSRVNREVQKFYKQLLFKEKRNVNQTLLHNNTPKPRGNSMINGRDLFPRIGDN